MVGRTSARSSVLNRKFVVLLGPQNLAFKNWADGRLYDHVIGRAHEEEHPETLQVCLVWRGPHNAVYCALDVSLRTPYEQGD